MGSSMRVGRQHTTSDESDTPVFAGAGRAITLRQMTTLFVEGQSGNHTTIWKSGAFRLDKQNAAGLVHFSSHNVDAVQFNNLSIQSGDASYGVLYLQAAFAGIGAEDVAGFRAPFVALKGGRATHNDIHFLRMLYTWLWVSNKRNKKMCITTAANFTITGARVEDTGDDVTQAKNAAKTGIT